MTAHRFTARSSLDATCGAMKRTYLAAILLAAPVLLGAGTPTGEIRVDLANLRNAKGMLFLCLSGSPKHFPDCSSDPQAKVIRVPAKQATNLVFNGVAAGDYALSVMHDENGNAKLDTTMSIPREGFGFSRNPTVRFGPPKYSEVRFSMTGASMRLPIKMKYFL